MSESSYQVARGLYVTHAAAAYTQAMSMAGANAILGEATCFSYSVTGGTSPMLRITVEESNDLENWSDLSESTDSKRIDFTAVGYDTLKITGIAAQYVRLKLEFQGSPSAGAAVVACGVTTSDG